MASAANTDTKKRLALAITDFLHTSLTDGTLTTEDTESVEVATSCIADAFKVDPSDKAAVSSAIGPGQNLLQIYSVYEKLKAAPEGSTARATSSTGEHESGATGGASATAAASSSSSTSNTEAENLKQQGNVAMQQKDYEKAIEFYGKAISVAPTNPIYLSNRAAAYSATKQHELARNDAEMAVASDPNYTKAWSRLGLARFALGDAKGSMEAYKSGIDAEGNGGSEAMKKGYETAKKRVEEDENDDVARAPSPGGGGGGMPDLGSLAGMFGGGGGGGGGMPDLGAMMNNPMFRNMANQVMSNPDMMNNLMNNPQLRDMAGRFGGGGAGAQGGQGGQGGGGGGMPDIGAMMNDPAMRQMAQQFMGGMGGGAGGAGGNGGAGRGNGGSS